MRGSKGIPARSTSSESPPRDFVAAPTPPLCLSMSSMSFWGIAPLNVCTGGERYAACLTAAPMQRPGGGSTSIICPALYAE